LRASLAGAHWARQKTHNGCSRRTPLETPECFIRLPGYAGPVCPEAVPVRFSDSPHLDDDGADPDCTCTRLTMPIRCSPPRWTFQAPCPARLAALRRALQHRHLHPRKNPGIAQESFGSCETGSSLAEFHPAHSCAGPYGRSNRKDKRAVWCQTEQGLLPLPWQALAM